LGVPGGKLQEQAQRSGSLVKLTTGRLPRLGDGVGEDHYRLLPLAQQQPATVIPRKLEPLGHLRR